jgi:hypothetical protein
MANIKTTSEETVRARVKRYARKKRKWPKLKSVRTVSGGLPSLGKRR